MSTVEALALTKAIPTAGKTAGPIAKSISDYYIAREAAGARKFVSREESLQQKLKSVSAVQIQSIDEASEVMSISDRPFYRRRITSKDGSQIEDLSLSMQNLYMLAGLMYDIESETTLRQIMPNFKDVEYDYQTYSLGLQFFDELQERSPMRRISNKSRSIVGAYPTAIDMQTETNTDGGVSEGVTEIEVSAAPPPTEKPVSTSSKTDKGLIRTIWDFVW